MKKLLILGGGVNQLPLIEAAKASGLYVIVCDYNQAPPGASLCDRYYQEDAGDREAVLRIARAEHIDGIIANTEALMCNVAFVSQALGLVGNTQQAVTTLISKSKFRELQASVGLYAPKSVETDDLAQARLAAADFTYPIIVKPGENSGSRGATVIQSKDHASVLEAAFCLCREISRNHKVILEEYVESAALEEVEAELFVHKGKILWDGLLLTLRSPQIPLIPLTDVYPLPYSPDKIRRIKEALEQAISAAGIVHGEYNAELFFTGDDRLFILEINARQGGDSIPDYVFKSTGVNLNKLLVTTAAGDDTYWESLADYPREIRYISNLPLLPLQTGRFVKLEIDPTLAPYVTGQSLQVAPGDLIQTAENASFKIGYVEFTFPSQALQVALSPKLDQLVRIVTE